MAILFTPRVFARNTLRGNRRRNTFCISFWCLAWDSTNKPTHYLLDHGSFNAADNAIFKNSVQNIECSFGCVAISAVLLKPNVANIFFFNFCEQKFVQHGTIMIAIDCNGLALLIFEEKWRNSASGPKSVTNSDLFWVRRLFNVCVRVFCAPNATILFVYIPAKVKTSFIWNDDFFFAKIGIFCKSMAGLLGTPLFNRIHNNIRSSEG